MKNVVKVRLPYEGWRYLQAKIESEATGRKMYWAGTAREREARDKLLALGFLAHVPAKGATEIARLRDEARANVRTIHQLSRGNKRDLEQILDEIQRLLTDAWNAWRRAQETKVEVTEAGEQFMHDLELRAEMTPNQKPSKGISGEVTHA